MVRVRTPVHACFKRACYFAFLVPEKNISVPPEREIDRHIIWLESIPVFRAGIVCSRIIIMINLWIKRLIQSKRTVGYARQRYGRE
jgi:hypothetical protein